MKLLYNLISELREIIQIWARCICITLAALAIASPASMTPTSPTVSTMPIASDIAYLLSNYADSSRLFFQRHLVGMHQINGVALVRIDMHFEPLLIAYAANQALQHPTLIAIDDQAHQVAGFDPVVVGLPGTHMHVACGTDHSVVQFQPAMRPDQIATRRAGDIAR